jgi:hypothetical protein
MRWRQRGELQILSLGISVVLSLSGCSRGASAPSIAFESQVAPQPIRAGADAIITIKLADASGNPAQGAHIALEADMSHAGMAPIFADAKEAGSGLYQGGLRLTMGGDWVILAHVTLANGGKFERQIRVDGVLAD